jgi:hypothetical protein
MQLAAKHKKTPAFYCGSLVFLNAFQQIPGAYSRKIISGFSI